jgi:hypothetical protein
MKKRSPIAVALLPLITFGIYGIYWFVKTKGELNARGAKIPTAILLIVPIGNIYWLYKYAEAVEKVTNSKMQTLTSFLLLFFIQIVGMALIQNEYNNLADTAAPLAAADPIVTPAPDPQSPAPEQPIAPVPTEAPTPIAPQPAATQDASAPIVPPAPVEPPVPTPVESVQPAPEPVATPPAAPAEPIQPVAELAASAPIPETQPITPPESTATPEVPPTPAPIPEPQQPAPVTTEPQPAPEETPTSPEIPLDQPPQISISA